MDGGLFQIADAKPLRAYQASALDALRASLGRGRRRPVLMLPTGGGKTRIAAEIVNGARAKGKRVVFCVPALSLIEQTVEAFRREGIEGIGVIQADHPLTDWRQPVQVASVQTLLRRARPEADVVVVDECHLQAKAIHSWMGSDPARIFIGLSATPWARGMGLRWDDLVIGGTTASMIEAGYLSRFRVFASGHPDLRGVKVVAGEYHQGQLGETMGEMRLVADVVSTWLQHGEGLPTLCFAVDRAHAKKLQGEFEAAGVRTGYVDAYTDRVERAVVQRRFESGEIGVVCNVACLTTGVDWPVGCIVDAAPTRSEIRHVQKIGRALRINPGIPDAIILDHADNSLRLGLVTDIHHTRLDATRPGEKPRAESKPPLPKECPKCAYLKAPKVRECPNCGHVPEARSSVDAEDGELVEITGLRKPKASVADKLAWLAELRWIAIERGYKPGWAAQKYRDKFGTWPPNGADPTPVPPSQQVTGWVRSRQIAWAKAQQKRGAAHAA